MKKTILLACGCLLGFNLAFAGQIQTDNPADAKWLAAVEKKITSGANEVTTPSEPRTQLLKDWAAKNGYSVKITKVESTYSVEFSKLVVKN